jgi:hypothetical protein
MGSSQHFHPEFGYLSPSFQHHRAMWATAVALACGVVGGTVGLLSLTTGQGPDFLSSQATVEPGDAELRYDFAALGMSGGGRPTAPAESAAVPDRANAVVAAPATANADKHCTQSTWPFFDNDCLWGKTADDGAAHRRRKRIVSRLRSPWCSGLHSKEAATICRPRT